MRHIKVIPKFEMFVHTIKYIKSGISSRISEIQDQTTNEILEKMLIQCINKEY